MESSTPEFCHKIEVLYMLSQGKEQADHPHMIQVQYPSHQQAPTLRDVKSRLTALRGRGMADSFAWSYKRSYKGDFIWCDVIDDDIILPLSQSGEYVLKALEVFDASQDAFDQEADQHCQSLKPSVTRDVYRASVPAAKHARSKSDVVHMIDHVRNGAFNNCASKQQTISGLITHHNVGIGTKACANESSDDCSTDARSTSVSDEFIENKRCLEKSKESESSTSVSGTNWNAGYQAEPCDISDGNSTDVSSFERDVMKRGAKELPSRPVIRTTDNSETSTLPFASSGFSRKEPVKSRTWIVKEEDNPAPSVNNRASRRHSDESCERESVERRRSDTPSTRMGRPCFPGDAFMFMLKKAVKFHRSQLCRKVEVVERFRAFPVEEPSSSRHTSWTRHGVGSKNVAQKPQFGRVVTVKSKSQRKKTSSNEPEKQARSLSEFLETTKIRSTTQQRTGHEDARKTGSSRHMRSNSNFDAYGTARCREVMVVPEADMAPERQLPREDEKAMSGLKTNKPVLVKPDTKSYKLVTKSAVRQSSKSGAQPSSLFNPASAQAFQIPTCTVSRSQGVTKERALKHQRSPKFVDIPSEETSIAREDSAVKTQLDLKPLKIPGKICYFSLPVPGAEKRASDTKVYPSKESSVFDSAALHSDNMQAAMMENPKQKVPAAPVIETSVLDGESMWSKTSASNLKSYKAREERPLTPGLTELRWESLLQKAVVHDQPPKDLVLHECFQCGRTFKPNSLKVHLRGCHIINKPKPSTVFRTRISL